MFGAARRLPLFKILAVAQIALLARRHVQALTPFERRRMGELVRRGHRLTREERSELRALAMKLEPTAFAGVAADKLSPFPVPKRFIRAATAAQAARSRAR
jgi:hypothetical protein